MVHFVRQHAPAPSIGVAPTRLLPVVRVGILVSLLLTGLAGQTATGQASTPSLLDADLAPRITQYVHDAWQVEDGLPQNSIYAAVQTRDGYLWLGTQEGLVRFDGVRFAVFDKARVEALKSNEVRALLEDREGGLWIGTNGGVTRLFDGVFTTYTSEDGLSSNLVRTLYEDRRGHIWIGTIEGGLNRFEGTTFASYSTKDGLAGNVVLAIEEDRDGALWIGTEAGLSRWQGERFTTYTTEHGLPGAPVWALLADEDGTLWVGATGGLARFREERFVSYTAREGLCGNVVSSLHRDREDPLWIGTLDGGLCRLQEGRFDTFAAKDGLTHNRVRTLHKDREGSLWIGTEGGGLNRLYRGKFTPLTTAEGLSSNVAFTVLEDRRGTLWIGTEGGGLNRIDTTGITYYTTANGLPSDDVYALHEDRQGRLWIGLYNGGLCRIATSDANGRLTCFSSADGLSSNNVYSVYEDRSGVLWIGTEEGLDRLEKNRILPYASEAALLHNAITALHEDRDGALWIGSYGGLNRLRDGEVTTYTTAHGLGSAIVLTLYEDREGALWIGTQEGGLCRMQAERIVCITTREGLFNDSVLQILEDEAGYLWLGSLKGISRVSKQALHDVAEGRRTAITSTVYGSADGLKRSETSGGTQPPAWRSRDGRLWFSTIHGVASIHPAHLVINTVPPPLALETVAVNGAPIARIDDLSLPPGSKDLTFQYTGLSFVAPEHVHFAYKLEGYDEAWTEVGARREAYYTNLAPGAYRFHVKARNSDGVWNENGAALSFYLEPHFYQTSWFFAFCVFALFCLGLAGYRLRISRLKARERTLQGLVDERTRALRLEKEKTEKAKNIIEGQATQLRELDRFKTRFFANISHEFRTPLTMIIGPLENALHGNYGDLNAPLYRQVKIMLRNALRLMRLINQLLDLSKLEAGKMQLRARPRNINAFLEGILFSFTAFAEQKEVNLDFRTAGAFIELYFEPDKLEKVFYNLLSNAMKFTPSGGQIVVTISESTPTPAFPKGFAEIRVQDSGPGIPAEDLPHIFDRFHQVDGSNTRKHEGTGIGLSLVKELLLLHHGTIAVESELGVGTEFVIALPRGKTHLRHDELALDLVEDDPAEPEDSALVELASAAFDFMHDAASTALNSPVADSEETPRILVVDDNPDVLEYISSILDGPYCVDTARDGQEGLEQARTRQPDLIISDVMMPEMDGHALCRMVKADPVLNHIPIILLTARATHREKLEGLEAGVDDYMAKPFNARELLTRTKNLLTLRNQEKKLKVLNEHLEQKVQEQVSQILTERERYEAELIAAKEKAEASSRLKSSILDNMSHELRTPIAAIQGCNQILAEEVADAHQEFTTYIEQNAQRLLDTLRAILDLASLESENVAYQVTCFDLSEAVQEAVGLHQPLARRKGLELRVKLPAHSYNIDLDRPALIRILDLLVGNAVKYTDSGEILVEAEAHHGRLTLKVRDTGIGISEAFLPHLFEAFKQESTGLTRAHEGSGLGLAITRQLVKAFQGEITVASEKGAGSLFTVSLPLALRQTAEKRVSS